VNASLKAGRDPAEIKTVAVTKTMPPETIKSAYDAGLTEFGENRVQEMLGKIPCLPAGAHWHMIGRLQKNKVKFLTGKVVLVHSLDSIELAAEIQKRYAAGNSIADVLIEVNVSGEDTKAGITPESINELLHFSAAQDNIRVCGLMTIAPAGASFYECRKVFSSLYKLLVDIKHKNIDNINMDILSMGMSNDFEAAIMEGSNMIRIGSAIFGSRS